MVLHLHRPAGAGLTSTLNVLAVVLNHMRPAEPAFLDIDVSNYGCRWFDLFDACPNAPSTPGGSPREDIVMLYDRAPGWQRPGYTKELLTELGVQVRLYMTPVQRIRDRVAALAEQYDIRNVTACYFRGTDMEDRPRASISTYVAALAEHAPTGRLWIQSDEQAFVDELLRLYPDRAFAIAGFRFSQNSTPLHSGARQSDAEEILTIVHLMSMTKHLIANISGVPWHALALRGSPENYTAVH